MMELATVWKGDTHYPKKQLEKEQGRKTVKGMCGNKYSH